MNDGLLHNFIDDIYKDKQGFLWISTAGGGLSRYDGYEFTHYNISTWPISLKSNFIRKVCEDNFKRLWIISEKGTDILNLSSLKINQLTYKDKTLDQILNKSANTILKDSRGNIWLSAKDALYKIEFTPDGAIAQIYSMMLKLPSSNNQVVAIKEINGEIWIGYNEGTEKVP